MNILLILILSLPSYSAVFTDDEIVELYNKLPAAERERSVEFKYALSNLKPPEETRPPQFFDAIASYIDGNRGGKLSKAKLDKAITATTEQYLSQLKDSQTGKGAQQDLAAILRVKTWKYLQKLQIFRDEMKAKKLAAWPYKPFPLPPFNEAWEKEHTLSSASEFQKRVCDESKKKPVLVKFGSTQCADCMLMEYTHGLHSFAETHKDTINVYKVWWGPNLPKEIDELRKREGAKSSPTFVMYKNGKRHACAYDFPDQQASGAEIKKCIAIQGDSTGTCGS
jgi:thiol-disulfide isomerase/thioredoxin